MTPLEHADMMALRRRAATEIGESRVVLGGTKDDGAAENLGDTIAKVAPASGYDPEYYSQIVKGFGGIDFEYFQKAGFFTKVQDNQPFEPNKAPNQADPFTPGS